MNTLYTPVGWHHPRYGELVELEDIDGDKRVVALDQLNQPGKKLLRLFDKNTGHPISSFSSANGIIHRENLYLSESQERSPAWKVKAALEAQNYTIATRLPTSNEEQRALHERGFKGYSLRDGELVESNWLGLVFAKKSKVH